MKHIKHISLFYLSFCIILAGTAYGRLANPKLTFSDKVTLKAGINKISLLSVAVGLPVSLHISNMLILLSIILD